MGRDDGEPLAGDIVDVPYLLALNVGVVRADDGSYHADRSWAKDLVRHFDYLPQLTYLAPVEHRQPPADYVRLPIEAVRVVEYPAGHRWPAFLKSLPGLAQRLWHEIGRSDIVHTGIAGHPVPVGWLAVPMARLRGKRVLVSVESAFWRLPPGQSAGRGRRLKAAVWERINRAVMRRVDHAFYSHDQYRASLPAPGALTSVTAQASWIDADAVLSAADIADRWSQRIARGERPRFLFAARMIPAKGTRVLLGALDQLANAGADIAIDVIGTGPELLSIAEYTREGWAEGHVTLLDPVPYGSAFMELLTRYDAVLAPSLSDEQPRIVYDAYAQGVPVIASDVPGLRMCVEPERTGRLIPPGDADALAAAIIDVSLHRDRSRAWALAGREIATRVTHDQMHRSRAALLAPFYPSGKR